ncbi:MAG: DUF3078 domain-containing protein [Bacteroidaceae bacterium]|nr:DUF3078 domain-containing protein [Bacteroidaceae bacterium]
MNRIILLSILFPVLAGVVQAREPASVDEHGVPDADSLFVRSDSLMASDSTIVGISDISDNPLYFRLFMPLTLYGSVIDEAIELPGEFFFNEDEVEPDDSELLPIENLSGKENDLERYINDVLMNIYLDRPDLVRMTEQELRTITGSFDIDTEGLANGLIQMDTNQEERISDKYEPEPVNIKPKYWKKFGKFSGKYTQSQYSDNWYKGGESNHSVLAQVTLEANYAKKQATLDNKLEMKLGYYTTEVDGTTKMKTNEDLLRLTSKYGLKAWQSWYYSVQIQGYTQFMAVYDKKVPTKLQSKFFAPAYGNVSIGMDYKPKFKNKNITLSAQLSPLSYNCRYVSVDSIATNFGIKAGHNFLKTIGSRMESNFKWKINDFSWTSKVQYFTNYESVEANIENTVDYQLNKYFSIQFFCHWRFDDSVQRKKNKEGELMGYHQYKEFLTLNFNYSW